MQLQNVKYRGKRKKDGEWVTGRGIIIDNATPGDPVSVYSDRRFKFYEVIPETVGVYIGIKDKNGADIFVDDIIRDRYGEIGVVIFSDNFSGYRIRYHGGDTWREPRKDNEVIGNIHDNPEMAEKLKKG